MAKKTGRPSIVPDERIVAWLKAGFTVAEMQRQAVDEYGAREINSRRLHAIARKHDIAVNQAYPQRVHSAAEQSMMSRMVGEYSRNAWAHLSVTDGIVMVGSDAHYWPGLRSTAHAAFVQFCKELRPRAVILNGDLFDGASISRFPRIGWDSRPTVKQELQAVDEMLTEIEDAADITQLFWPLGNHDMRFEVKLAANAPEYEGVQGFTLKERFPSWRPCWAVAVNSCTVVKHRFKGGIHAPHNNALWGGKTIVTGHLHSQRVVPLSDYNGTRWGVDCGTMADPTGPQFVDYTEASPLNWRSGFVVLTYHKGQLLAPELVRVLDENHVDFRGHAIEVK